MAKNIYCPYRLYQDNRKGAKHEGMWYAKAVTTAQLDLDDIADRIQENTTAKAADCYAVLKELVNVMRDELRAGHAVKINGLGIFRVGISTSAASSASAFKASSNIKSSRVLFLAEKKYLSGTGKGHSSTNMLLSGIKFAELPKNDVDTSKEQPAGDSE